MLQNHQEQGALLLIIFDKHTHTTLAKFIETINYLGCIVHINYHH